MQNSKPDNQDLGHLFAKNIVAVNYQDIPADAVDITKKSILDTMGVILGASGTIPGIKKLVELLREIGGKEESTIIGFGDKVPAWTAAFANGAMAHCLDYDDLNYGIPLHPSSSTVPAGLAVAERLGSISGKQLIAAVAIGSDLSSRLGLSITWKLDWHISPLFGVFSAAATSGKLLGLSESEMVDAFGIALCQAAGTLELRYGVGTDLGGMYAAFPAKGGVLSALMAQRGITGIKNAFEGKAGLFNVYFDGQYNREILRGDLGKKFESANTGFKPWPSCGSSFVYVAGLLEILEENNISPESVDAIKIVVGDMAQTLCEPLEARRRPITTVDAKYSLPFTLGVVAAKKRLVIRDFTAEGLTDPAVLKLAQKVDYEFDRRFNMSKGLPPGLVHLKTKDGKVYSKQVDFPYGHPSKPMSWEDISEKFRDCASYAAKGITKDRIEKIIDMTTSLEKINNVSDIIRLLC